MARDPRLNIASVVAIMVVAAGCTGRTGHRRADGAPAPRSAATSATPAAFGARHLSLGCAEAVAVRPGETVDQIPFRGLAAADTEPPLAQDVGLRLPAGMRWYFRKNPLSMGPGAADFTVSLAGPRQALAWVPAAVWTTDGRPDLTTWAASSLTLHSCPDRAVSFLGGILAADLRTCLQLTMREAGHPERTIRQRLDGSPCTE